MDLRGFYQKLRKIEQEITAPHVVVVSQETSDGGRAGQKVEVTRAAAAKLIVEGRSRLATAEETAEYRDTVATALREAEERAMSGRVQVNLITDAELRAIKSSSSRPEKR
jgi:stalled ribosome rescue protein Dom34